MLAKVHLAAKELGLQDDARRDVLERLTGHRSSTDCSDAQLDQVLVEFKRLGWTPKPANMGSTPGSRNDTGTRTGTAPVSKTVRRADHPAAKKARALWISLHQLGVVRDRSEKALESFARRQLKVDRLQWADPAACYRLIEALKAMAERAGWSQDLAMVKEDRQVFMLKARLANAQATKLGRPFLAVQGLSEKALDQAIKEMAAELHAAAEEAPNA
jgi:phage gp16-like protein